MIVDIATHPITELLAILTFVMYVFLAAKGNIWCWAAGFLTSFLYTFIFLGLHFPSQLFLNILYMIMSVWGWSEWTQVRKRHQQSVYGYTSLKKQLQFLPLLLLAIALCMLFLPSAFLNVNPIVDAGITVTSIYATILTVYRRIESWLYWIVLNAVNAVLFLDGQLTQTAILYATMAVVAVYGYINWQKLWREDIAEFGYD
ncbi:MAG: nicotinamide riboside transporter PnuC [Aestuariibacter sp.]